ncbi:MAG: AraC family transcriptional regulator, partial [Clostridiales bacterium]|nr:AraC family transcriptional regulator [Clostridiales bacterium]
DYIIKKKIYVACELLSTTKLSVSKVAECIGYTHMPYFSKIFKKETGMTPNEYRNRFYV